MACACCFSACVQVRVWRQGYSCGCLLERPGERRERRDEKLLEERDGVAHLLRVGVRLRVRVRARLRARV